MAPGGSYAEGNPEQGDPQSGFQEKHQVEHNYEDERPGPLNLRLSSPKPGRAVEYCHLAHNLRQLLYQRGQFECPPQVSERYEVTNRVLSLFKTWLYHVMDAKGLREALHGAPSFRMRQFGSLRLGVQDVTSDIDLCFVGPRWISREEFFSSFPKLTSILLTTCKTSTFIDPMYVFLSCAADVKLEQYPHEFTKLSVLPLAFVPVIRVTCRNFGIDIVFARAEVDEISRELDLLSSSTIESLVTDIRCVRSLNGYRVTEVVLRFVPRYRVFQLALKTIRFWAKCHKIYSHTLGYLGGVSWAILVAKVCTIYPKAGAARIVNKFFLVMSQWRWPEPVMLLPEGYGASPHLWSITQMPWDIMPIITPVYPQQNSSFNVSKSTLLVMKNAFTEGLRITDAVLLEDVDWEKLFEPMDIFSLYEHFVILQTVRHNTDADDKELWVISVERCMKKFLNGIDQCQQCPIEYLHVSPDYSVRVHEGHLQISWLFGVQFLPDAESLLDDLEEHTRSLFSSIASSLAGGQVVLDERDFIRSFFVNRHHARELMEPRDIWIE
ncbi:poly(A) polymerase gamma-like [Tropilaelaps mercedesae]|uniref:polynucleotide adenylyltransferase n=1 Tax=Tropilaelaps mercedesae TaxID=418985 RepID=A0A1V9XQI3_9ACAR|nr:poly(A) polymerase gamma-like [Tropilaelaps mercedesae]